MASPPYGRSAQEQIYRGGAVGARPRIPVGWDALEDAARRYMPPKAWAYIAANAGLGGTADANRAAFDRWRILPRMLRDVSERDLSIELFGHRYPTPVLASPVGVLELVHRPDAELALARAAAAFGIPVMLSNQGSTPMERVAAAGTGAALWFQLYWSRDDDLVASLVRRAEAIGARAIVVTLDTQLLGWRPRDLDAANLPFIHGQGLAQYTSDPVFRELVRTRIAKRRSGELPPAAATRVTPRAIATLAGLVRRYPGPASEARAAVETFLDVFTRTDLTWGELPRLRELTGLPIVLKGVQHPDDARRALDAGVDGVIVSNHAGRQLDGAVGSLDALPGVVEAVGGRIPVLLDSGVRGGADVVKALALGATAVGVGRRWVYGLAIAGETGARESFRNLLAELDLTIALAGETSVRGLSPEILVREGER